MGEKNSGGGGVGFDAAPRAKVDRATLAIEDDAGGDRVHCVVIRRLQGKEDSKNRKAALRYQ
jgi:hypothetical protein